MHKLRNTQHIELLNFLLERYKDKHVSKREMREICISNKWNIDKIIKEFDNDSWWYRFIRD